MEIEWTTQLQKPEDVLKALSICGLDLGECLHQGCVKTEVICDCIARTMAGRTIVFDQLINALIQGCANATPDGCTASRKILNAIEVSRNSYISVDGRKFWPDPTSERRENKISRFCDYLLVQPKKIDRESHKSSIVTMGSCFMNEINKHLASDSLLLRKSERGSSSPHTFPANWGTIFNPLSAQYALEWYFGERERPEMLWKSSHSGRELLYDVFREDVTFTSLEEYKLNQRQHISNAKELIQNCKSFVCAFSMTETWLTNDGCNYPLARAPWKINPLAARPHNLTFSEVEDAILNIAKIINRHNRDCNIYVGVDPVPLHATHSYDNAVIADSNAKATLIAGTTSAIRQSAYGNLHYVPFYESIHYCMSEPWASDERHLNKVAIVHAYKELLSCIG